MPSPREIGLKKNIGAGAQFDVEPDDTEINPLMKEPDYRGDPSAAPRDEKAPFKNLRGG